MNRYTTIKQLGDGTYGSVILGRSVESGELVAIKKMKRKFYSWDECMNLREVKENLYQLMKDRNKLFPESTIRNIMYQILQGLAYIHKYGFFHRDLKPENLLCMGPELVKIADFGLARETRSRPPYTDYVSTRWYRAPEVILRSTTYNSPIDIWAVGCIMAEVYTLRPLFPGSSEIDTVFKICQVLGTPKKTDWIEGYQLASAMNFRWPQCVPNNLKTLIPNASGEGIQIMRDMIQWDPKKRPSANQALRYSYFQVGQATGTTQRVQEFSKPQKDHQERQISIHMKPVPPSQPPPKHQARLLSRTFQQSQVNGSLFKMNPPWADSDSISLEKDKFVHPQLPVLNTKTPQQKTSSDVESGNVKNRRRWGHITKTVKTSEEWVDLEDDDFHSSINGIENKKTEKTKLNEDVNCSFESILDLKHGDMAGPVYNSFSLQDSSTSRRASAAKQHYLKHSRYLPGLSINNSAGKTSSKDCTKPANHWPNPNQILKPLGLASGTSSRLSGQTGHNSLVSSYMPSFLKKDMDYLGQKVHLTPLPNPAPNMGSLKSIESYIGKPSLNASSKNIQRMSPRPAPHLQPIHGRTDWLSKYGGRR
ncbi:hypothetical protein GDO86_009910 [Hymenochirus boettgeri]|uniref:Protein kinase domain-containing protein n=1 Tax=Hymenochirus boettgeri TaxID=247094 RepID=A0A8T2JIC3_9PIPI|nr:hypothetical protein GDO86_009910 [Hymenochirus boettgeri]